MPAAAPQLALRNATVTFGGKPLFADITMSLGKGERVCLVGANGSGKSTILKVLAGESELDGGERFIQPGITVGALPQNPDFSKGGSVAAYVSAGLHDPEAEHYKVDAALDHLQLDGARDLSTLSGGEGRRAALARVLVSAPDLLLLDEPTNHLDLPTIEWLEEELASFSGGILMISHDRTFLTKLTRRLLWLDRGRMFEMDGGFAQFEEWSNGIIEQEASESYRLQKRLEQEEYWLQRGVTARRSRNEGRRRNLMALRKQRADALKTRGTAKLALSDAEVSGQIVCEATNATKRYRRPDGSEVTIVENFSTRIQRGDRIGLIGPNGAGKSTLLKLLTGQIAPDSGTIKLGTNLLPLYLDQRRTVFDLDKTLWQTLAPGGGDSIMVRGQQRHVVAYLRDFLFSDKQATMTVRTLSGGERARLMMARLFAQPSNLIVLDEPTNDLDMDTLDLLEEVLEEYDGTLLLVSHDRDFLDRLVTSLIAVEGDGDVAEYPGGYSDYLLQRPAKVKAETKSVKKPAVEVASLAASRVQLRLTSKEQRELEDLPNRIATLEKEVRVIETALADQDLYAKDAQKFHKASELLEAKKAALSNAEFRWLELDEKRASLAAS